MIAWTIATTSPFTLSQESAFTSSVTITQSNSASASFPFDPSVTQGGLSSFGSGTESFSRSYSERSTQSIDQNGTTTGLTSSVSETGSSSAMVTYIDLNPDFNTGFSGTTTASSSTEFSTTGSTSQPTLAVETSTTITQEVIIGGNPESYTYNGNQQWWTTSSNTENESIEFYLTEVSPATDWSIGQSLATITVDETTTLAQTTTAAAAATVVQAANTEVLYFIADRAEQWNGYVAATDVAESGARFTIVPRFVTTEMPAFDAANNTTSTTASNNSLTYGLQFTASQSTNVPQTRVANYNLLPNSTFTQNVASTTTQTSSMSGILFASESFALGRIGGGTGASNTTSQVTSYTTRPTIVGRTRGTVTFQSTVATTTSQQRLIVVNAPATLSTSASASSSFGRPDNNAGTTEASGRTVILLSNQTAYGPAQIGVGIGNNLTRSRFVTAGAGVGSQRGLFFTASPAPFTSETSFNNRLFVDTARAGDDPRATILMPRTVPNFYTLNSNSITYRTTTSRASNSDNTATSQATTETLVYGLDGVGQTFVATDPLTNNRPLQHGALSVGKNYTIIDEPGQGAYKDRIGGTTTSFNGVATSYTSGQSTDIRSWFPICHISPLALATARNGITFSAARNSSVQLPPA